MLGGPGVIAADFLHQAIVHQQVRGWSSCSRLCVSAVFLTRTYFVASLCALLGAEAHSSTEQAKMGADSKRIRVCTGCCLQGAVWSCVLNDPALLAATASADFSARVWNAVTGDELHKCVDGGSRVGCAALV
jgi:WD40 repeat protein